MSYRKHSVAVVIPHFNRVASLRNALQSIAYQTRKPEEVIIVDDGSVPENLEEIYRIVREFSNELEVKLIKNEENRGANVSRNIGVFATCAKYIAFLDSDDFWLPIKIERQMDEILLRTGQDLLPILSYTGRYRVDADGEILARQFGGRTLGAHAIRQTNFIGTLSSVVVDAALARDIGGFDEALGACQDWDFFIRASEQAQFVGVPEPLCVYVEHQNDRISSSHQKRLKAQFYIHRKYVRTAIDSEVRFRSQFYRSIAADYQQLGNRRKAASFLAAARMQSIPGGGKTRKAAQGLLRLWYLLVRNRSEKDLRYAKYKNNLNKILRDPHLKSEIDDHYLFIRSMLKK